MPTGGRVLDFDQPVGPHLPGPEVSPLPPWSIVRRNAVLAGLLFGLSIFGSVELARHYPKAVQLWINPGLLPALLLLTPRRHWAFYCAALMVADVTVFTLSGYRLISSIQRPAISALEALIVGVALSRDTDWLWGRSERLSSWARFLMVGVILAPAIGAIPGGILLMTDRGAPFVLGFRSWFIAHALAISVIVPFAMRMRPARLRELHDAGRTPELLLLLAVLTIAALAVFTQPAFLPLLLITPLLVVILFRVGFVGLVAAMMILTTISATAIITESGPFEAMAAHNQWWGADGLAQIFLMLLFCTLILIACLDEERHQLQRAMHDAAETRANTRARFFAMISHELRTPMTGIIGFTELLLSGELREDQRR
jgi:integral membrane sensor domain MASE1